LVAVATGWLLVLGLRLVIPALLPFIKPYFVLNNTIAGATIILLSITYAFMQFPAGLFTDYIGERLALATSVALVFVGVVGFAVSFLFTVFVLAVTVLGLGSGLFATPRVTVLSYTFPRREGFALGITFAAGSVGAAGLPAVASLLAERFGWRVSFLVWLPVLAVLLYGILRFTPRMTSEGGGELDIVSRANVHRLVSAVTTRTVLTATVAWGLVLFSYQGLVAFLATYLVEVKQFEPGLAASFYTLFFAVGAVSQPTSGSLSDKYSPRYILVGLGAIASIPFFLPFVTGFLPIMLLGCLLGIRRGTGPVATSVIVGALPDDIEASGLGLLRTGMFVMSSIGPFLVGWMADADLFS
jgi:MFS family permease